ncbi:MULTISPECIES: hypothetical protein [unclassified Bradyrhizobium]|jgi:hypothetical protein|nr:MULTISPECIES: hypothetical protein [unclassified Bradyrhizobium]MCK1273593.1 hypothetical protein [Bradyrhizobium sp. 84]MCK1290058.1 hypothetical protein [Bradyrhizobium sp. 30]MCK1306471.1 hypothetical protein [Bradyrhizobium sp. 45]MCK1317102.1 hypothetical protein [Bradyrhizobium sp. 23]MCK1376063.1 hypothetical protein [Bradyrhizobium sp. 49]
MFGAARLQVRERCIMCGGLIRRFDHDLHGLFDLTHHFDGVVFSGHDP